MRKSLLITAIILSPLILYGMYAVAMGLEFAGTPEALAEKLVEQNRPAEDCFLFRTFDLGPRPTTYEMQMRCVYVYAKMKSDPTACEELMPSDYGLSCLANVGGTLFQGQPCHLKRSLTEIYCTENSPEGIFEMDNFSMNNCEIYSRNDVRELCWKTRTWRVPEVNDCSKINNELVKDECEEGFAFKQKDATLCSYIEDGKRREYCEIRVNTWLNFPELRGAFYFGVQDVIDS
jgi:hypothetical protein